MKRFLLAFIVALCACTPSPPHAQAVGPTDFQGCTSSPWDADGWVGPTEPGGSAYWHFTVPYWYGWDDLYWIGATYRNNGQAACVAGQPGQWGVDNHERGMRGFIGITGSYPQAHLHVYDYFAGHDECWVYQPSTSWQTENCAWFYIVGGADISPPLMHDNRI